MSRIRTVKPELFRHEDLFELEMESQLPVRLSFIALFTVCDRDGRFKWRPRQLKLDCLPYDNVDFSRVLDALTTRGFVEKYSVDGSDYGVIPSFPIHQVINNRESLSCLPCQPILSDKEPEDALYKEETPLTAEISRVLDASTTRHDLAQGEEERERERERERNTTVLLRDDREEIEVPQKNQDDSMAWVEFFVNKKHFQIHEAQTAKTIPMFIHWVSMGVTTADVELAMIAANNALNGSKPSNPLYYRNFVDQVMQEKQKSQLDRAGAKAGSISINNGADYATNNKNFKAGHGAGRKLSLVEEAELACQRVEDRERRELADRERVIN